MTAELAFLTRALKAPTLREAVDRLAERARAESWTHEEFLAACLQREVVRPGVPRRRRPDPRRPVPGPQSRWRTSTSTTPAACKRDLIAHLGTLDFVTAKENVVLPRPARHRQDPPRHRARDPRLPGRAPGPVRDRLRMGRPPRRRPPRRPPARRTAPPRPLPAAGHRRGRLHPVRTRSREPVLPARLLPLRTRLADRHQQQAVRPLGRGLRRRHRRRRHDRPPRPPRRRHRPQRRLLPTQEPRPRPRPHQRPTDDRHDNQAEWSDFTRRPGVSFQPSLTRRRHQSVAWLLQATPSGDSSSGPAPGSVGLGTGG